MKINKIILTFIFIFFLSIGFFLGYVYYHFENMKVNKILLNSKMDENIKVLGKPNKVIINNDSISHVYYFSFPINEFILFYDENNILYKSWKEY